MPPKKKLVAFINPIQFGCTTIVPRFKMFFFCLTPTPKGSPKKEHYKIPFRGIRGKKEILSYTPQF